MANHGVRLPDSANFGLTATKTILQNQVRLLRFWADNIERFTLDFESETEKVNPGIEQEPPRAQAAE